MGVLSISIKPNFLGLLKFLNSFNWFIVFFSFINLSVCIYEDQIGKFDWRQTYVGRIKFSQFDTVSTAKKIIVATEENVLAALNLKTGQVVWRHVLESASTGNIQLLHVSEKVVTVTGSNPYLVRGWDATTGVLLWEWSLTLQKEEHAEFSEWWVQQGMLVHLLPVFGSHLEVSMYNLMTGQNRGATSRLPAIWTNEGCVLSAPYYSCVSGNMGSQLLLSLDVTSNAVQIISKPLSQYISEDDGNIRPLDANSVQPGFIIGDKKIVLIKNNEFQMLGVSVADQSASVAIVDSGSGQLVLQSWTDEVKGFSLTAHSASTGAPVSEIRSSDAAFRPVEPELAATLCSTTPREMHACRLLITAADDSVHLMQQGGRILWSREEALANVVAVEFVDLPVSDLDAAIESEFDQKEGSVWAAFSRRLQTQFQQLQTLIQSLKGAETNTQDTSTALVRDYFNLHKIIVLVTDAGKIFGMDNLSGEILWQRFEPSLDAENVVVFTRRSARHPPLDAYLTIVGKHEETGNGLIISLNPIRGTLVGERVLHLDTQLLQCALLHRSDPEKLHALLLLDKDENVQWYSIVAGNGLIISLNPIRGTLVGERVLHLDTQLLQCALLHRTDPEKLHALLLLDKDENVQVFPASAGPLVENMYLYVADKRTADVQGYALKYDGRAVVAQKTWALKLGGGSPHRIVAARAGGGRAGSAGRVLGDRSVLYKHANPNMVLFVTEGPDPIHKDVVVATCVDAASGAVLASAAARRARALPLAVQQDNFAAFVYHSDKHRRTEIGTLELYEGKSRWLEAGTAFSSFRGARAPSVYRAAYVLPAAPRAFAVTTTERSLTDKHVLHQTLCECKSRWLEAGTAFSSFRGARAPSVYRAAYVLPAAPRAFAVTTTERSLTDKHVLLALSTGAILELPWAYLEPRRPLAPTPEQREEGLIPYAPELPLPADAVLNYNRTLHRINAIYTAPSGLESTSLVLATGLDLFYTRVAPNKTFDLLKDDFDYYLITVVLGALILATYSTKYFAARKMLKMAWK